MQTKPTPARRRFRLNSVLVKSSVILAVGTVVVAMAPLIVELRLAEDQAMSNLRQRAGALVDLLGHEAGDTILSRDAERIDAVAETAMVNAEPHVVAAMILDAEGGILSVTAAPGHDTDGMQALGKATINTALALRDGNRRDLQAEELLTSPDGLTTAHPAYVGDDKQITGVIVTRWTDAAVRAVLTADMILAVTTAGGLLLLAIATASMAMRSMVSRPLTRVNEVMKLVAQGDYAVTVPATARGDEIGAMARSLEGFRSSLSDNLAAQQEAALKGAAFNGTSAGLMLLDKQFSLLYMNPALATSMDSNRAAFAIECPGFNPKALIGKSLYDMHPALGRERGLMSDPANLPAVSELRLGALRFQVDGNAVRDRDGAHIGYVVEWKNVTAEQRQAAVLAALDVSQLRAEILPDGRLETANARFCEVLGQPVTALIGKDMRNLILINGSSAIDRLADGETLTGHFTVKVGAGSEAILHGGFSPVRDRAGKVRMWVFLASDVTEQSRAVARAEAQSAQQAAAQRHVVDALRVALGMLSEGDLTAAIHEEFAEDCEQLRHDFNAATARLSEAMREVTLSAAAIHAEAGEISSASDDMSRRTEQQAATLEQTAAALDQLTASVKSAADGAAEANGMVSDAKTNAEKSGEVVREAVVAMGEIEESSRKISKITSVIDEIAFQTNLLALNAGVEAARAGEAGRGFAVVASEVRALAQRSSDAAQEIAGLIEASSAHVKRGVNLVGQAGNSLSGIETSVTKIYRTVMSIAASAKEQAVGLAEINVAVNQLDQVTQQNAAMFEEATAASQSLTSEAEALSQTMGRFRTGSGAEPETAGSPAGAAPRSAGGDRGRKIEPARQGALARGPGLAAKSNRAARAGGKTALAKNPAKELDDWQDF